MAIQATEPTTSNDCTQNPAWYRALTLRERLTIPAAAGGTDRDIGTDRMRGWQTRKPLASQECLADWLAAQGLTAGELATLLGESPDDLRRRTASAPAWVQMLAQAHLTREETSPCAHGDDAHALDSASVLDAFAPAVQCGLVLLKQGLAELSQRYDFLPFDPIVIAPRLVANLSTQLIPILTRTLSLELHVARLQGRLRGDTPEARFADFLRQLAHGAVWPLLEEYPVLARQLVVQTTQWADSTLEVLDRVCRDWPEICATFSPDIAPDPLVEINGGGDTHRQGRMVMRLRFGSGFQLIYKPRSLTLDTHFNAMLAWLNERGDHPPFRITRVLDRGNYGWVEFITPHQCETAEEIERFYQRQGGYLALLYLLHATDFHYENLIAAGEHPVLIDLEALFHSPLFAASAGSQDDPALDTLAHSVLLTGLLPQRAYGDVDHAGIDLSGLNGHAGQLSPQAVLCWQHAGTDEMRAVRQFVKMPGQHNRPRLQGRDVDLLAYAGKLRQGFADVYRLVVRHNDELIAGPLADFAGDEIRLLARPTNAYAKLLQESHHPDLLRDAMDRERLFAMLWGDRARLSRLIPSELADVWNGDIPMFTGRADSRDVFDSRGERIPGLLAESGMDRVTARVQSMAEADLARQLWIVDASLTSTSVGDGSRDWRSSRTAIGDTIAGPQQFLDAARAVGDRLCEIAVSGPGGANWLSLSLVNEREWQLSSAGMDMYDGLPGIILTLAYLGRTTGEERYSALAREGLRTLERKTSAFGAQVTSVGAFGGCGSLVYLYSHLFALWGDDRLLNEAAHAVGQLRGLIARDEALDIIGGSAGAILALLSLYRAAGSDAALAVAAECGRHLVDAAQPAGGALAWRSVHTGDAPLAGFSHGAAGIAYSLLALAAATGAGTFRDVALSGIAYERSVFSAAHQNWPILRRSSQSEDGRFRATWCHGAAGIGMARLAGLQYVDDATVRQEIDVALRTTLDRGFGLNHSLCHGDLGNLELLLGMSRAMPDEWQARQLNEHATMVLTSIDEHGYLSGTPLAVETPGLMTGIAGIGYQLLRLAEPERVPSVLLLAPPITSPADIRRVSED